MDKDDVDPSKRAQNTPNKQILVSNDDHMSTKQKWLSYNKWHEIYPSTSVGI